MMYAVLFEDDESHAHKRAEFMNDHLKFLVQNTKSIQAAGPLKDTHDNQPAGGLWIVNTDNQNEVQSLVEADPFWPTGLRKSIRILEWTQVFCDGERLI